jgi:hypothetical protein
MPASAIYDLEVQPDADDLIVAAHGRGVWILDDFTALQQWAGARWAGVVLFAPRNAYRMWRWAPLNSFGDPPLPPNEYVGGNAHNGAIFTYYFAKAPKSAAIQILDANGRVVRRLQADDVPKKPGMNRASWNLHEDGPVKWTGTYQENQGPDQGVEVVPGPYVVRLVADGVTQSQPVTVKFDPRDPAIAGYQRRHDFLAGLYAELGSVDAMLNQIGARLKRASPAQAARLKAFERQLTYDPQNVEDLSGPAALREELMDLIGRVGDTSFQAPTAAQVAQGKLYEESFLQLEQAARGLGIEK